MLDDYYPSVCKLYYASLIKIVQKLRYLPSIVSYIDANKKIHGVYSVLRMGCEVTSLAEA